MHCPGAPCFVSLATVQFSCSISTHTCTLLPSCAHTLFPSCAHAFLLSCAHTLLPSCAHALLPTCAVHGEYFILHLGQHGLLSQTISLLPEFKVRMGPISDKIEYLSRLTITCTGAFKDVCCSQTCVKDNRMSGLNKCLIIFIAFTTHYVSTYYTPCMQQHYCAFGDSGSISLIHSYPSW